MTEGPVSIALVITAMGCGGAERVLATLATHLAARGHRVTLFVLHEPEVFFPLHAGVTVRAFATEVPRTWRWARPVQRVRWLRSELARLGPRVVVSFIDVANAMTLLAARGLGVPVVVAERIHPPEHRVRWPFRLLRCLLYRRAAGVVVQTAQTAAWARRLVPADRVIQVPNPVAPPSGSAPGLVLPDRLWMVGVGRLDPQKRFDVLIRAFAALAPRHPAWSLLVLGEGPGRRSLEDLVRERGLAERVWLPGTVQEIGPVLRQCRLFALTSRYEGFPNALCEAMACGLPAVSFDCPTGPAEIIRHGVDGLLVPDGDAAALEGALDRLMGDAMLRETLGTRASEVTARFSAAEILARWEALCVEVAEAGTRRSG
ncbi:MAG: glycosyltransferase family 4 protein [Thermoanaerobaculaceae bacterium]|jgi:glycosyltransferase involved in cell wall biosynthesis|nr:glycosyltransferase family 4 protein [Thermoanaerobaculaceae bacterium]